MCCATAEGVPLELGTGAGVKKTSDIATGPINKFDDNFSRVDTIHQRDKQFAVEIFIFFSISFLIDATRWFRNFYGKSVGGDTISYG